MGRWLLASLLGSLLGTSPSRADDPKRCDADEAKKLAQAFTEASAKLENPPLKITPDTDRSTGLKAEKRGLLVVPDTGLKLDALKKLDRDIVPLGLLYTHRIALVVAEQLVAEEKNRSVEVSIKDKKAKIVVMHLAAAKVAGQLVLLVYTNRNSPALVTTLVETEDAKDHPLGIDARKAGDNQATLVVTVLGRYRAAVNVAAQD